MTYWVAGIALACLALCYFRRDVLRDYFAPHISAPSAEKQLAREFREKVNHVYDKLHDN